MECLDYVCSQTSRIVLSATATCSLISSALIVSIIARSSTKMKTIYHRFVTVICVGDIISSAALSLNTIPMPSDTSETYPFDGARGTVGTCMIQGFAIQMGTNLSFCSTISLSLYYLLTIRFSFSETTLKKRVEPIIHTVNTLFTLYAPIYYLVFDMYNPVPFCNYCQYGFFPFGCNNDENVQCIRGSDPVGGAKVAVACVAIGLVMQLMSMISIVFHVWKDNAKIDRKSSEEPRQKKSSEEPRQQNPTDSDSEISSSQVDKDMIVKSACMYTAAGIVSFGFGPQLHQEIGTLDNKSVVLMLLLKPSQGILNLVIFVSHKIYNLRKCSSDHLSVFEAIYTVIIRPSKVPEIILDLGDLGDRKEEDIVIDPMDPIQRPRWFRTEVEDATKSDNACGVEDIASKSSNGAKNPEPSWSLSLGSGPDGGNGIEQERSDAENYGSRGILSLGTDYPSNPGSDCGNEIEQEEFTENYGSSSILSLGSDYPSNPWSNYDEEIEQERVDAISYEEPSASSTYPYSRSNFRS